MSQLLVFQSPGPFCQETREDLHFGERRRKGSRQQFLQMQEEESGHGVADKGMESCKKQQEKWLIKSFLGSFCECL